MGIGDMVIFLPYIEAISQKYNVPVTILVKENSKASQFLDKNKYINKIILLDRGNNNGKHDGFTGSIRLAKELKNGKSFYDEMSKKCRENYEKSLYNEKNFVPYIEQIFERLKWKVI